MLKAAASSALILVLAIPGRAATTPDQLHEKVRKLQAAGQTYDAATILRSAVKKFPEHVPLRIANQNAVINGGQYKEQLEYDWAVYESSPTPLNAYLFARIDLDTVRARETVQRALRTGTKHPGILWLAVSRQAADLAAAGKHEAALKLVEGSREGLEVEPATVLQALATLHAGMGKLYEAQLLIDRAAKLDPQDAGIHATRLGILELRGERMELSIAASNPPRNQRFAYVHAADAARQENEGDLAEARESWRKVLEAPLDPYGWNFARARARHALGEQDAALEEIRDALKLDPNDAGARLWLAHGSHAKDPAAAEETVRLELERNPRSLAALEAAAAVAFLHGRFLDALSLYDRALALAPGVADLWISRGALLTHLQDRRRAARSFEAARELAHGNPRLAREYGRFHAEGGDYVSCMDSMRRLAMTKDAEVEDLRFYARCSVGADYAERGIAAYHRAQEKILDPRVAVAVAKDITWAKSRLAEASARFPRDQSARRVKVKAVAAMLEAPQAAYLDESNLIFGAPWGKRLNLTVSGWPDPIEATQWSTDGKALYVLSGNSIRRVGLPALSTTTFVSEAGSAARKSSPEATLISTFEILDKTAEAAMLTVHIERGKAKYAEVVAMPLAGGKSRLLHRRTYMRYLMSARPAGKLFVFGGGNLRIDPSSGPALAYPLVGCNSEFQPSPDGKAMVCVSADAKTPENGELYLYEIDAAKKTPLEVSGRRPAWSPDGRSIAYVWRDRELRVLDLGAKSVAAYALPFERDELAAIRWEADARTEWSRDGRFIYLTVGPALGPPEDSAKSRTSVVVDLEKKTAWMRPGPMPTFDWAPTPIPL